MTSILAPLIRPEISSLVREIWNCPTLDHDFAPRIRSLLADYTAPEITATLSLVEQRLLTWGNQKIALLELACKIPQDTFYCANSPLSLSRTNSLDVAGHPEPVLDYAPGLYDDDDRGSVGSTDSQKDFFNQQVTVKVQDGPSVKMRVKSNINIENEMIFSLLAAVAGFEHFAPSILVRIAGENFQIQRELDGNLFDEYNGKEKQKILDNLSPVSFQKLAAMTMLFGFYDLNTTNALVSQNAQDPTKYDLWTFDHKCILPTEDTPWIHITDAFGDTLTVLPHNTFLDGLPHMRSPLLPEVIEWFTEAFTLIQLPEVKTLLCPKYQDKMETLLAVGQRMCSIDPSQFELETKPMTLLHILEKASPTTHHLLCILIQQSRVITEDAFSYLNGDLSKISEQFLSLFKKLTPEQLFHPTLLPQELFHTRETPPTSPTDPVELASCPEPQTSGRFWKSSASDTESGSERDFSGKDISSSSSSSSSGSQSGSRAATPSAEGSESDGEVNWGRPPVDK